MPRTSRLGSELHPHSSIVMELTDEKLKLRQNSLRLLMSISDNQRAIYECADDWCSKQSTTNGLASYFKAYYDTFSKSNLQ